jgi:hypothetical protein
MGLKVFDNFQLCIFVAFKYRKKIVHENV